MFANHVYYDHSKGVLRQPEVECGISRFRVGLSLVETLLPQRAILHARIKARKARRSSPLI